MTAENSKPAPGRPWKKGESGNPGGRKKGLPSAVRELYSAETLVQGMVDVADGKPINGMNPTVRDIMDARKWLADRGWGKAVDWKPVEDGDPLELGDVPRQIASVMDELAARRSGKAAGGVEARAVDANSTAGTDST